jgi:hypothetical protein
MTNRSRRGEPGLQRYESTWIRGIEREELRRGRLVDMVTGSGEKKNLEILSQLGSVVEERIRRRCARYGTRPATTQAFGVGDMA